MLVAGPAGNPLQAIVKELEKGIYCDIESSAAIFDALVELRQRAGWFRERHRHNRDAIAAYAAPAVAAAWGEAFDGFLADRPAP